MFDPGPEGNTPPYTAFRFQVELSLDKPVPGITGLICRGDFAECCLSYTTDAADDQLCVDFGGCRILN